MREFPARPLDAEGWGRLIADIAKPMDLASPILLNKHVDELARFNRTWFTQADFIESISFDRFELEIFPEKKKDKKVDYIFGDDRTDSSYASIRATDNAAQRNRRQSPVFP